MLHEQRTMLKTSRPWLTPGRYIRKSTLRILAKQFCGDDIPTEMFDLCDKVTFPDNQVLYVESGSELNAGRAIAGTVNLSLPSSKPEDLDTESDGDV